MKAKLGLSLIICIVAGLAGDISLASDAVESEWTLMQQAQLPPFDPQHPDHFACPKLVRVTATDEMVVIANDGPDPRREYDILPTFRFINQGRVCRPIQLNGGIFSEGRLCEKAQRADSANQSVLVLDTCRSDFPVRCFKTQYRWTVKMTASRLIARFDCVNCSRTLKTGVCKYGALSR